MLTEDPLLAELKKKCDHIIELEQALDFERAKTSRLSRSEGENDATSAAELRMLMADLGLSTMAPAAEPIPEETAATRNSSSPSLLLFKSPPQPPLPLPMASPPTSASAPVPPARAATATSASDGAAGAVNTPSAATNSANQQDPQVGRPTLRARVVELELLRRSAVERERAVAEELISYKTQVEQLKNVIASLSQAPARDRNRSNSSGAADNSRSNGNKHSAASLAAAERLLPRPVPDVPPAALLLLLTRPWAPEAAAAVRHEHRVVEWQNFTEYHGWSGH
ncbi:unnamed protein product, partial [Phaeothamnion confervicola]